MGAFEKAMNKIGTWGTVVGMVFICLVTVIIAGDVVARHLGTALPGTYDLVETLIVVGVSATLIYAQIRGSHTKAEIVIERLRGRTKAAFESFTTLLALFYWVVLAYAGADTFLSKLADGEETQILNISIVPFRGIWVLATLIMAVMLAIKLVHHVKETAGKGGHA